MSPLMHHCPCVSSHCCTVGVQIKRDMLYLLSEWATCRSLLSPEEREFVQKYADLKGTHFTGTVLESLPTPFKELSEPEMGKCVFGQCVVCM